MENNFYKNLLKTFLIQILAVTTDNASNNITFLHNLSSELSIQNIEFDYLNQHVRCLAHVINLAAQQALNSLRAVSNTNEDEFLDENENNNEQITGETANILHKVNYYLFIIYYQDSPVNHVNSYLKIYIKYNKFIFLSCRVVGKGQLKQMGGWVFGADFQLFCII